MREDLIRNKNYLLFVFGQATSSLGTNLIHFATGLYLLDKTGSASALASIMALAMLPNLILGPLSGLLVDRINRKKLIVFADLFRGSVSICFVVCYHEAGFSTTSLYFIVLLFSSLEVFFAPAFTTILPGIVSKDKLTEAIALKSTIGRLISIASPVIAAFMLSSMGFVYLLLFDGVTYLISGVSEIFLDIKPLQRKKQAKMTTDFIEGVKSLFNRSTKLLLLSTLLINLMMIPFLFISLPIYIIQLLNGSIQIYGFVQSAGVIGGLISILMIRRMKNKYSDITSMIIALTTLSSSLFILMLINVKPIVVILSNRIYLMAFFFSLIYLSFRLSNSVFNTFYSAHFMTQINQVKLGRYVSLQSSLISLCRFLGLCVFGYLFDHFDYYIAGLALLLGIGIQTLILLKLIHESNSHIATDIEHKETIYDLRI